MKHNRTVYQMISLLFLFSINALATAPENFMHSGQVFQVLRLGKALRVAPVEVTSRLEFIGVEKPDCVEVRRAVNAVETQRQICLQNPGSSACRTLAVRFRFLVEGRPNENMNIDHRMIHAWKMSAPNTGNPLPTNLVKAVGQSFGVDESLVEIESFANSFAALSTPPVPSFSEEALTPKIESVVPLNPSVWMRNGSGDMQTQNLAVACDLLEGNAYYLARGEIQATRTESFPQDQLNILWDSYKYLSRFAQDNYNEQNELLQGLTIGFHIAKSLPDNIVLEGPFAPSEIFRKMYQTLDSGPRIRVFSSQQMMRNMLYPDQAFTGLFQPIWRIQ
jgi:hypothetical protein